MFIGQLLVVVGCIYICIYICICLYVYVYILFLIYVVCISGVCNRNNFPLGLLKYF